MHARFLVGLTLAAALAGTHARANDSSAELGAGGLVLTQNSDIEMRSEDLYISTEQVRVRYVFFNRASRDVTVHVAFPMPDITGTEDPLAIPTEDPTNILAFSTRVNGVPVNAQVEQKVFADGKDHTQLLQSLGVPLAPHIKSTDERLDRLPPERWTEFERLKLAEITEYDEGKGMQKHLVPRWTLKTTWYWEQTFAANAQTGIEHVYKPATGQSVGTSLGAPDVVKEDWFRDYQKKYCMDRDFLGSLSRARARAGMDFGAPYQEHRISYILTTGANWAGPIRTFRLVVDKGDPSNLVSFCGQNVKKISPTQFEIRRENFIPAQDFYVLIMKPNKLQ